MFGNFEIQSEPSGRQETPPPPLEQEIETHDNLELSDDLPEPESFLNEIENEDSRYQLAFDNLQKVGDTAELWFLKEQQEILVDLRDTLDEKLGKLDLSMQEREELSEIRSRIAFHLWELSDLLQPDSSEEENNVLH